MAIARKIQGTQPDELCDDGKTKKLNKSRHYGIVYAAQLDGHEGHYESAKFVQDGIVYRGDGIPCDYIPASERGMQPVIPPAEELLEENESLRKRVSSQGDQIQALMARLEALESKTSVPIPPAPAHKETTLTLPKRT